MRDLTERQREILDYIAQFTDDNAYAPTVREICEHFNISIRAVQDHISALQKKGVLSITRHRSRSMRVVDDKRTKKKAPVCVSIPIVISGDAPEFLGEKNVSGTIFKPVSSYIDSSKTYFAFHVDDDGMKNVGILEGDFAIAERLESCADGQIAVVFHDGRILVRRIVLENSSVCLRAENESVPPVHCKQVKILGTLVEISRSF